MKILTGIFVVLMCLWWLLCAISAVWQNPWNLLNPWFDLMLVWGILQTSVFWVLLGIIVALSAIQYFWEERKNQEKAN